MKGRIAHKTLNQKSDKKLLIFCTMGFTIGTYSIFIFFPMLYGFVVSFFNWNPFQNVFKFVGVENYINVLQEKNFWNAIVNTSIFTLGSLVVSLGFSLLLAAVLQVIQKGLNFYRAAFFLPVVTSMVAASILWKFLFGYNDGFFNSILMYLGLGKVPWLMDGKLAMVSIIIVQAWKDIGYALVLLLAGINNIDVSLYESADLDGCSKPKQFFYITMPLIKNTMTILIITKLIGYMQVYTPIKFITNGGPGASTETVAFYIFEEAFSLYNFGSASAVSFILFLIIFVFSMIQIKVGNKEK